LTKEPKLDRARRQIPEWESYDNEIDKLRKHVANAHTTPVIVNQDQIVITSNPDNNEEKPDTHHEKHIKDEL
jgi:UDP-glucose:glycoprotein glucosyltransferase